MSYVNNPVDGHRTYYESIGHGPPLMLYHGAFGSSDNWHDRGYVDAFKDDYRVILIDSRAHGRSDSPHDIESYSTDLQVGDMLAVLDELQIEKMHYVGYSYGGWFAYALLKFAPERLMSVAIGGKDPFPKEPNQYEKMIEILGVGIEQFVLWQEENNGVRFPEPLRTRRLKLDAEALRVLCINYGAENVPGILDSLDNITMSCMLYAGTNDPIFGDVKRAAALVPMSKTVVLDGFSHPDGFYKRESIQPILADFLSRANRNVNVVG